MPLRAVFLDVGNTLLRENPSRFAIYAEAAQRRGIAIDPQTMRAHMARAHRELPRTIGGAYRYSDPWFLAFIQRIFHEALGLAPQTVEEIAAELFARFESPLTFHLFPGAEELLAGARQRGLVVGLISNWSARLPRLLSALGWDQHLDFVLCSALVGLEKPDPEIFRAALARAAVDPDEALHAGDDWMDDIEGALGAGIDAVLVDHGASQPRSVRGADAGTMLRVTSLRELAAVILERAA